MMRTSELFHLLQSRTLAIGVVFEALTLGIWFVAVWNGEGLLAEGDAARGAMEKRFAIPVPAFGDIAKSMFSKQRTLPFCDCFCCGNNFLPVLKRKGVSYSFGWGTEQNRCILADPNPAGYLQKELDFLADSAYSELPDYSPAGPEFMKTSRSHLLPFFRITNMVGGLRPMERWQKSSLVAT